MQKEEIIQALLDAGCEEETIHHFIKVWESGKWQEARKLLSCQRCKLLHAVHEAQRPIDIMDYLLYQLDKEN